MEELNTLLIVGLIGFGSGALVTAAMVLLVVIYNNINAVSDKQKDDDDDEQYLMPISSLMGGGRRGGNAISMADLQAYAARAAAGTPPVDDAKKATGGQYI